jgi:hypothetical protein
MWIGSDMGLSSVVLARPSVRVQDAPIGSSGALDADPNTAISHDREHPARCRSRAPDK